MEPAITVVVPVKDRREQMMRCLDACLALDHPSYEVLVADNGSTDGTIEMVRERAAASEVPVRLIEVPGSVGRVRNEAARQARGALLAFTDSDCLPEPQWLRAAEAAMGQDALVGIVCGPTLPEEEPTLGWPATQDLPELTGRFETCNVVYRKSALVGVGGFDEDGFGWEDTAGAFAVMREGWDVRFAPEAVVRHDVTYPGFWWHVRRQRIHLFAGAMVRRFPETRRQLLYLGLFTTRRHAWFTAFLLGLVLARRFPPALLLTVPYVRFLQRFSMRPRSIAQATIYDGTGLYFALRSAVRYRRAVL